MKEIFLFRHAEASPIGPSGNDHSRSLTTAGHLAATQIGDQLLADSRLPDLVISSDAERARQSALLAMTQLGRQSRIVALPVLYECDSENILALLAGRPENGIMVVGHNPTIETLVEILTGKRLPMSPGFCLWMRFDISKWEALYGHPSFVERKLYKPRT